MNARRPQEIQHERQEAPAGPKLSARKLQEASQNELTQKPPGAVESRKEPPGAAGSRQEPAGRETWELSGAHQAAGSCREPSGARQEPSGAATEPLGAAGSWLGNPARAEILEGTVWGALKIEHYVLHL